MSKTNTAYANTLQENIYISSSAGGGGACFRRWTDSGENISYSRNGGVGSGVAGLTTDGLVVAGNASMPTYDGTSSMTGNSGKGHAKISYIESGFTVTFDANGGSVDPATKVVYPDDPQIGDTPIPTNGNKKFLGWFTDEGLTSIVVDNMPVYDNITLYAKWMENNTVDFSYIGKTVGIRVPENGTYKLEVWGAQGGSCCWGGTGGKGGYAGGNVVLEKNSIVYVTIGNQGSGVCPNNTNGSDGYATSGNWTYMSKTNATYSNIEQENMYISSSAGGGGACFRRWTDSGDNISWSRDGGVGTGIAGLTTGELVVAGNNSMPTHDGTSTMTGNTGNGYAKLTFVE